ncbi:MAG: molybdenum cofactor guanylyltransferase [Ignavibacteriales bacterium]|jgi:molybdopterin-guanine dinucleotide biosynthesis protein A|nr:MAG: molybdenum cofactor guanylyltransferase [Ignavibacteriales bacterium]
MKNDITGIILCGGKSSRMKTNKALLKLGNKTIIEIILDEMKKVLSDVVLSANECDDFAFLNIPIVKDIQLNRGPLSGIYSALKNSKTSKNFIVTCDLPLIDSKSIEYFSKLVFEKEIVIPIVNGIPQRLFGLYNKSVIEKIEEIFRLSEIDKSVKGSVYDLHQRVEVESIVIDHLQFYNDNMFLNMNTPDDYEKIKKYFN